MKIFYLNYLRIYNITIVNGILNCNLGIRGGSWEDDIKKILKRGGFTFMNFFIFT
jgi:hypothetical protein